jgi:nicotinate-nucleotide pyrophosphorylase (carboxylating)
MVVCGLGVAEKVFKTVDESIEFKANVKDGDFVKKTDVIATVTGNARSVLTGERTALNLLQRMTGIATRTSEAVKAVEVTNALIADTRKTTPALRVLEKYAVRMGGGTNHRFNLSDGILIKDTDEGFADAINYIYKNSREFNCSVIRETLLKSTWKNIVIKNLLPCFNK